MAYALVDDVGMEVELTFIPLKLIHMPLYLRQHLFHNDSPGRTTNDREDICKLHTGEREPVILGEVLASFPRDKFLQESKRYEGYAGRKTDLQRDTLPRNLLSQTRHLRHDTLNLGLPLFLLLH